jgi:hypothetical protein
MSTQIGERQSHSADVHMELHLNGHTLTIGHMGPDYVIVDKPIDHPPAEAELVMSVDADVSRWPVYLVDGVSSSARRIQLARRP